ncbi:MAG: hypothetical protein AAF990_18825 [Bacteroidota bacterium]
MIKIEKLTELHNEELLSILEAVPMVSPDLTICVDQRPNIFTLSKLQFHSFDFYGFYLKGKMEGFAAFGYHDIYINGERKTAGQLTHFYLLDKLKKLGMFYRASKQVFADVWAKTNLCYLLILDGNDEALDHIGKRHPKFPLVPHSRVIGHLEIRNIVLTFAKKESRRFAVRRAERKDIDVILKLLADNMPNRLFGMSASKDCFLKNLHNRPNFDISNYFLAEKDGQVVGVCCAWDPHSFKRNRVLSYNLRFLPTRMVMKTLSSLFSCPALPRLGEAFRGMCITEFAVPSNDPAIMEALLRTVYNHSLQQKYNLLMFASFEGDPLLAAAKPFLNEKLRSVIVGGSLDETFLKKELDTTSPYIDMALL